MTTFYIQLLLSAVKIFQLVLTSYADAKTKKDYRDFNALFAFLSRI